MNTLTDGQMNEYVNKTVYHIYLSVTPNFLPTKQLKVLVCIINEVWGGTLIMVTGVQQHVIYSLWSEQRKRETMLYQFSLEK